MAMTARAVWEGCLVELSKVNAPSMLLQDFNYYLNKAVNQYINKKYNIYDINQQSTDDLRVLKSTAALTPHLAVTDTSQNVLKEWSTWGAGKSKLFGGIYEIDLPTDYLHMLNCICVYLLKKRFKCYNANDYVQFAAKRLTADSWSTIVNDYYNRPKPERPYYYIHNINRSELTPTNQYDPETKSGTDFYNEAYQAPSTITTYVIKYKKKGDDQWTNTQYSAEGNNNTVVEITTFKKTYKPEEYEYETVTVVTDTESDKNSGFSRTLKLTDFYSKDDSKATREADAVEREAGVRYGNNSNVRCEIRYGADNSIFELVGVSIDYIKAPQEIRLTQEQVDLTEDTSQILEYPDNACHEIINELIHLVMEATADPRLLTHIPVTQSVANPAQQLAQPTAQATQRRA